jgi:hypothetical protein
VRRPAAALLLAALVLAGCGSHAAAPSFHARGPAGVVRIALSLGGAGWPLDPAFVSGRDETVFARALFATPLRTDSATGALRPGLCRSWRTPDAGRTWRFDCSHARAIAAELERMRGLRSAPFGWLFSPVARVRAEPGSVEVRLRSPWRRFPYVLTVPAAAPRGVPGPFRTVRHDATTYDAAHGDLRLVFRKLTPFEAVRAFRRGEIDDAPIPLGDLRALRRNRTLGRLVHVRPLRAVDVLTFEPNGSLARTPNVRRVYRDTVQRADYQALVPEGAAPAATSIAGGLAGPTPRDFRDARRAIGSLPHVAVRIAADPGLADAAEILVADWRDVGLGPLVVHGRARPDASFRRVWAPYPRTESLFAAILLPSGVPWRSELIRALAERDGQRALEQIDRDLTEQAAVIPVAWVAGARLVSPRLSGWRQDALGNVDYTRVAAPARSPAESRSP